MCKYRCEEAKSLYYERKFLKFPSILYPNGDNPRNRTTERQILQGIHPISCDIEVHPYIVLDDWDNVICRCLLTYYEDDDTAYVGFFDAFDQGDAVRKMFMTVEARAKKDGKCKLFGPIDSSIYIGYRFKVDRFDKTYTSEPYNKPYYARLWEESGFKVCEKYISNQLRKVEKNYIDNRLQKIYDRYKSKNYEFVHPTHEIFDDYLRDVYKLMMKLYSNFSGFKMLSEEQFLAMYMPLEKVLNLDMVHLVYNADYELCAFCICLPNYGDLTLGKLTLSKIKKIQKIKENPTEYVVLYLGADTTSAGLGGALVHHVRNQLYRNGCTSIGALIKEGNITGKMYEDLYTDQFHYVLLEKEI